MFVFHRVFDVVGYSSRKGSFYGGHKMGQSRNVSFPINTLAVTPAVQLDVHYVLGHVVRYR